MFDKHWVLARIKVGQKLIRLSQQPAQDDKRDRGRGLGGDCNEVKTSPTLHLCNAPLQTIQVYREHVHASVLNMLNPDSGDI